MRYLLSGATGYVGKHVLARLLADGHAVTVLVRPRQGRCHARIVACLHPFDIAPSGGALPAIEVIQADLLQERCGIGDDTLAALVARGAGRVAILVGGRVRGDHVRHLVEHTGAREVHARAEGAAGVCRALREI